MTFNRGTGQMSNLIEQMRCPQCGTVQNSLADTLLALQTQLERAQEEFLALVIAECRVLEVEFVDSGGNKVMRCRHPREIREAIIRALPSAKTAQTDEQV